MSNAKPDPHQSTLDALAALQGNKTVVQPSEQVEPVDAPSGDGALSASGFVGMLAKTQPMETEPLDPAPRPSAPTNLARPQPKAAGIEAAAHDINTGNTATIGQAREIQFRAPTSQVAAAPRYHKRRVPGWYKPAVPIMFTVGSLLMLIGFWSVGACLALVMTLKGYPLLDYVEDDNGVAGFTTVSKVFAGTMLLCLPVAVAMYVMGAMMRKQIMAAEQQRTTPI